MILSSVKALPANFLWGASTSAYQVEGANLTHGKGPSVQDIKTVPEGTSELDVCSDFYHRYKEDIALVEELLHSYETQKKALVSQIKEAANEVNIDYRYAMQNLLVLA